MIVQCKVSGGFRESEKTEGGGGVQEGSATQCQLDQRREMFGNGGT